MEKIMNKLLATVAIIATVSFAASANAQEYATIIKVKPNYQNVQVQRYRTDWRVNQVPIYESVKNGQASTSDTIVGAVIGGAIGNQFGNGSGKDAATVLGAIIGADVADKKPRHSQQIIGYREEQTCNNVTYYEPQEELKNYTIIYEWNGYQGQTVTYNNYRIGDRIPVNISIQAE
jgi:uncharacterized protein YcfJ